MGGSRLIRRFIERVRPRLARWARLWPSLVRDAADELRVQWRVNALTLISLVWGGAAVVVLVSVGAGFNRFLDLGVQKTGDRWFMVRGLYATRSAGLRGGPVHLDDEDVTRVRAGLTHAVDVAAEVQVAAAQVRTPRRTRPTTVAAVTPEIGAIQNHSVARGRFFGEADVRESRKVAVIGAAAAGIFFGSEDPVGRTLQVEGRPFEVVGVLERKGFQLIRYYDAHDNMVFLPLSSGRVALGRADEVGQIYVSPARVRDTASARAQVLRILGERHRIERGDRGAFGVQSVAEVLAPTRRVATGLEVLLGAIGVVTLGIGGIGVANVLIATVNDRKREFAVRQSCGAHRSDIVLQILVESSAVVFAGGCLGILAGSAVVGAVMALPLPGTLPTPTLSPGAIAVTFSALASVGVCAGVVPARIAARVEPATALREAR